MGKVGHLAQPSGPSPGSGGARPVRASPEQHSRRKQVMPSLLILPSRRSLLKGVGTVTLSAAAVSLLAGHESLAANRQVAANPSGDVDILNTALGLEYQAIAAYQVGADSGLLQKPVLDLAVQFQGDHKQHADVLASTIGKLGGKPVAAKKPADYNFPVSTLKNQADVLRF